MAQELLTKAVKGYLPEAIPTVLGRIDEYTVGKVLIYSKKPKKFFTRKYELDFTGWSLQSLLAGNEELSVTTATNNLFSTGKETESKSFNVNRGTDLNVSDALKLASANADTKLNAGETATLEVTTDFGKISHVSSDLVNSVMTRKLRLQPDHTIVRTAVENGGIMYVISNIYESEHCNVSATVSKDTKEDAGTGRGVEKGKAEVEEGADSDKKSEIVVSRDKPTALAYMLLKVKVNTDGIVTTQPNRRFSKTLEVHYPYPAPLPQIGIPEVEILGEKDTEVEILSDKVDTEEVDGGVDEVFTVVATPTSSQYSDEPDGGMPDKHFLYSLKDFQPFESHTYRGILEETRNWVAPFVSNSKLQTAFLAYTKLPGGYEKLNELSAYFLDVGNAMRAEKTPPPNKLKHVEPILAALSEDKETRLDEISSVVIVAEAADEFPQHILKKIFELAPDKREILTNLILQTPYGTMYSSHSYTDSSPFKDPVLKPIMSRMGFHIIGPNTLTHTWTEADDDEDKLASGLILLLASEQKK